MVSIRVGRPRPSVFKGLWKVAGQVTVNSRGEAGGTSSFVEVHGVLQAHSIRSIAYLKLSQTGGISTELWSDERHWFSSVDPSDGQWR